jgi:hypothetical protein
LFYAKTAREEYKNKRYVGQPPGEEGIIKVDNASHVRAKDNAYRQGENYEWYVKAAKQRRAHGQKHKNQSDSEKHGYLPYCAKTAV